MDVRGTEIMEGFFSSSAWSYWSYTRLLKRSCESLLDICDGIAANGDLNDREIKYLDTWLSDNQSLALTWPVEVMYARIKTILADNKITEDEHKHLKQTLSDLICETPQETSPVFGESTSIPIDSIGSIKIKDNTFCFTGNFLYGTRNTCELAINERGGTTIPGIRKDLNYLVLGTMASRDRAHISHNSKIERALEFKKDNCSIFIISEKQWIKYL